MTQLRKSLLVCYLLLCSQSAYSQELVPEDPYDMDPDVPYITDNLVEDPLSWTGPASQGDCTYRPTGSGTVGNDPSHWEGTWYSNPAYRSCPQISEDGTMRFGWRPEDNFGLTNTIDGNSMDSKIAAYATAFSDLGIMVNGYTYSWEIRSKDAENARNTTSEGPYDKIGLGVSQDLLNVKVEFLGGTNNDVMFEKNYDYNYRIEDWETFSGQEDFEIDGSDLNQMRMTIEGYDAGYWSGYFGPEIRNVQLKLLFTVQKVDNCEMDPASSPACAGYQDAFNTSIGMPTQAELIAELEEDYGGYDDGMQDDFVFDGQDDGIPDYTDGFESFDGQDNGAMTFDFESTEGDPETDIGAMDGSIDDHGSMGGSFQADGQMIDDGQPIIDDFVGDYVEDYSGVPIDDFGSEPDTFSDFAFEDIPGDGIPAVDDIFVQDIDPIADELYVDLPDQTPSIPSISINPGDIAKGAVAAGSAVAAATISGAATSAAISSSADVTFNTIQNNTSSFNSQNQDGGSGSNQQINTLGQGESTMGGGFDGSDNGYGSGMGVGSGSDMGLGGDVFADTGVMDTSEQDFNSNFGANLDNYDVVGVTIEIELETINSSAVNAAIQNVVNTLIGASQLAVEEEDQSPGLSVDAEDALVEAALSGDTGEDAQSALLGYNPKFRAYVTPQLPDTSFYLPRDIYPDNKNYDNPSQRFFSGASDQLHRNMIRKQYE
jgi:hypothetical protein